MKMTTDQTGANRQVAGFTIGETVMAVGILGLLVLVNFAALSMCRTTTYRVNDRCLVHDFMVHYLEQIKSLPFDQVVANQPVNGLYNGVGGVPNIRIPVSTDWFALTNADYQAFHPDLVWLSRRSPAARVTLTTTSLGGQPHDKQLSLEVRWQSQLSPGQLESRRLDLVRVRDL